MATIRKRGARWQIQVRRQGYPLLTKSFALKSDAEAWGRQKEVELDRGEVILVQHDLQTKTLGDLLSRYKTEVTPLKRGAGPEAARLSAMLRHPMADVPLRGVISRPTAVRKCSRRRCLRSNAGKS